MSRSYRETDGFAQVQSVSGPIWPLPPSSVGGPALPPTEGQMCIVHLLRIRASGLPEAGRQ